MEVYLEDWKIRNHIRYCGNIRKYNIANFYSTEESFKKIYEEKVLPKND
jgi:hypothetical protein